MYIKYSFLKYFFRQQPYYRYFILLLLVISESVFADENPVSLSSREVYQGEVIYLKIKNTEANTPVVKWMNRKISLLFNSDKKVYEGFLPTDLKQKPGTYNLELLFIPSGVKSQIKITIIKKDYGVRKLTLPPDKVNLSAKDLARADKEKAIMERIWAGPVTPPVWQTPFIMPIESKVTGIFGKRSIINNQPRSPHSGVDLRGKKGDPVKAVNDGFIVFTGDHFFTGNSVVIDHGGEIFSMYFHLDKINVKKGEKVFKGEVVGLVGSTGRSTEPHLHWGMRINNMRIDPISFVKLSRNPEE
jgi:murein DD-endopeptidase MepM/ murein hydrolase activator NlpD